MATINPYQTSEPYLWGGNYLIYKGRVIGYVDYETSGAVSYRIDLHSGEAFRIGGSVGTIEQAKQKLERYAVRHVVAVEAWPKPPSMKGAVV
jgi:hypothetical protein